MEEPPLFLPKESVLLLHSKEEPLFFLSRESVLPLPSKEEPLPFLSKKEALPDTCLVLLAAKLGEAGSDASLDRTLLKTLEG